MKHGSVCGYAYLILSLFYLRNQTSGLSITEPVCVPSFEKDRSQFDKCKTNQCFIFLEDDLIVFVDPDIYSEPAKLFKCRRRRVDYPKVHGLFFDVVDAIPVLEDALCIYAGDKCTFDEMVMFTQRHTNDSYQFIVGGFMMFLSYRLHPETQISAPFMEGSMIVVAARGTSKSSFNGAFTTVFEPFRREGWYLVFGVLLLIVALEVSTAVVSLRECNFAAVTCWLFNLQNEPTDLRTRNERSWRYKLRHLTTRSLSIALGIFFAVLVLLYEIAVATRIFEARESDLTINFRSIRKDNPQKYALPGGGATEHIFREKVRRHVNKDGKSWSLTRNTDQVLDQILDPNSPVVYGISYDRNIGNNLAVRNLCDKIVVLQLTEPLHEFVGGWYYSKAVSEQNRRKIDQGILDLRLRSEVGQMVKKYVSKPLHCGRYIMSIGQSIIFVLLLFTVFPFLLFAFVSLVILTAHRVIRALCERCMAEEALREEKPAVRRNR